MHVRRGEITIELKHNMSGSSMSSADIMDRFMRLRSAWSKLFAVRAFISLARACNQVGLHVSILSKVRLTEVYDEACSVLYL